MKLALAFLAMMQAVTPPTVNLSGQLISIPLTTLPVPASTTNIYEVVVYMHQIEPCTEGRGSVVATIAWDEGIGRKRWRTAPLSLFKREKPDLIDITDKTRFRVADPTSIKYSTYLSGCPGGTYDLQITVLPDPKELP